MLIVRTIRNIDYGIYYLMINNNILCLNLNYTGMNDSPINLMLYGHTPAFVSTLQAKNNQLRE
jgi:hypothetical protein